MTIATQFVLLCRSPGSGMVRSGLSAGGKRIRTAGPTVNGTEGGARRLSAGEPASEAWDLEFEPGLLQR
jgi:hypothetical protein